MKSDLKQHKVRAITQADNAYTVEIALSGAQGEPGPTGPKGDKGDKGDQGTPGLDALESYVDLGDKAAGFSLDYTAGRWQRFRLTGNISINAINNLPVTSNVGTLNLLIVQDATGGRLVTWPGSVKWPQSATPWLSSTANQADLVSLLCVGGTVYGVFGAWGFP